jgi:hypothetical protein
MSSARHRQRVPAELAQADSEPQRGPSNARPTPGCYRKYYEKPRLKTLERTPFSWRQGSKRPLHAEFAWVRVWLAHRWGMGRAADDVPDPAAEARWLLVELRRSPAAGLRRQQRQHHRLGDRSRAACHRAL